MKEETEDAESKKKMEPENAKEPSKQQQWHSGSRKDVDFDIVKNQGVSKIPKEGSVDASVDGI